MNYHKSHQFKTLFEPGCLQQFTARSRGTPGKVKRSGCPKSSLDSLDSSSLKQSTAVYSRLQFSVNPKNPQKILYSIQGVLKNYRAKKEKRALLYFRFEKCPFRRKLTETILSLCTKQMPSLVQNIGQAQHCK